jgi:hypothetical protein
MTFNIDDFEKWAAGLMSFCRELEHNKDTRLPFGAYGNLLSVNLQMQSALKHLKKNEDDNL